MDDFTVVLRLLASAAFGSALGFERELRGHKAGLRTHILVCLGACVFTVAGIEGSLRFGTGTDAMRIASQVVVGIGFLGGGAILRHGTTVRGLTTAANLWVTSAVGVCAGVGLYMGAAVTTALALFCLAGLKPLERWLSRHQQSDDSALNPAEEDMKP